MKKSTKVFGIDLGTTYSCISYVDEYGKATIIPNRDGERTTPSVVCFDIGSATVGSDAKDCAPMEPQNVCTHIKRQMGVEDYSMVYHGVEYTPEEISSFILRKLVQDASEYLNEEVHDVVITCPAYFFVRERNATKRAGELAGLNVLQIVNEPTAAAVSYGYNEGKEVKTALVYDLGGGTFDVTVMRFSPNSIEAICTDGDHRLGGKDWDDRLVTHVAQKFCEATGCTNSPLEDPESQAQLFLDAEKAKKSLSARTSVKIRVSHEGERENIEVTREEFEELTRDLLERTVAFTKSVLKIAADKNVTVDEILLVGGSSKMPAVSQILKEEFNLPLRLYDPDESVAKGAAIIGNNLRLRKLIESKVSDARESGAELVVDDVEDIIDEVAAETGYTLETVIGSLRKVKNVASKSFGVPCIYNSAQHDLYLERLIATDADFDLFAPDNGMMTSNLIFKNTSLPAKGERFFATMVDDQAVINFTLCENQASEEESEDGVSLELCSVISKREFELPPRLEEGTPLRVTFELDEEGLLTAVMALFDSCGRLHTFRQEVQTGKALSEHERLEQERRCSDLTID
ncbi:MAG: Hsp70 family protein [Planctomycetia bacterium]|nr:Hsp70 family protein [Planctomycetia bacterium]